MLLFQNTKSNTDYKRNGFTSTKVIFMKSNIHKIFKTRFGKSEREGLQLNQLNTSRKERRKHNLTRVKSESALFIHIHLKLRPRNLKAT